MKAIIVHKTGPVTMIGAGPCTQNVLKEALEQAACLVTADGGAERALALGRVPDAVIGDMDSVSDMVVGAIPPERVHRIAEQDSTDFDKCLRHILAPLVLGYGFLGGRLDHQLAALTVLARYPERRCILVGEADVVMLCPPRLQLDLAARTRVSLYPLAAVRGRSEGLRWPIDGLDLAPDGRVGTSNEALGPVVLRMEAPRMLLILPVACLPALRAGLDRAEGQWPARAE